MAQRIEVPGHGIVEFPDGMSDDQIATAIKRNMPQAKPSAEMNAYLDQRQAREAGWKGTGQGLIADATAAVVEPAMKMGSQIIAKPVSEIAGMTAALRDRLARNPNGDPTGFRDHVREALTYEPRTTGGQIIDRLNPMNAIGALVNAGASGAAGLVSEDPNSAAYQGTREAINQAIGLAGARGAGPIGRGAGAATQKVADAIAATGNMVRPQAIAQKRLTELAGDNKAAIANALAKGTEFVPGSRVTSQEAIAEGNMGGTDRYGGGLVKLQQDLTRVPGYTQDKLSSIEAGQEAARRGAIGSVAQTPAALDAAVTVRKAAADPLYKAARESVGGVDTRKSMAMIDDAISRNLGNERLVTELKSVRKSLKVADGDAERVASVVDSLKDKLGNQDNKFIKGHLASIKDQIVSEIPGMPAANAMFAEKSKPVNQMQVGQALESKLVGPRGEERAGQFANAVREAPRTIKKSTGQERFQSLEQVLTPQQMQVVDALSKDVSRDSMVQRMARDTSAPGDTNAQVPQLPMMLNPIVSVANKGLRMMGSDLNVKTNKIIADTLADPAKLREVMLRPESDATRRVVEAIIRAGQMSSPYQENQ